MYAMGVGFCGLMTIFTLSAIAAERYLVITAKPLSSWKMDHHTARKVCVVAWVYSCGLTLPPVLGWSRYVPEGLLTSCSWDYTTRSPNNTSYYLFLLSLGFFLPVSVISYCYTFIVLTVVSHGKDMATVNASPGPGAKESRIHSPQRTALRTAEVILTLVGVFLGAWSPYTVVTFIGQFGDRTLITPLVATLPAYFAKSSVLYNPIVYGLSHPHFRSTVRQYLRSCLGSANNSETREPAQRSSHHRHYRCFPKRGQDMGGSTGCRSSAGPQERRYNNSDYITTV